VDYSKEADGGTLFLDKSAILPVTLQAVLLRFLDDWTVLRSAASNARSMFSCVRHERQSRTNPLQRAASDPTSCFASTRSR